MVEGDDALDMEDCQSHVALGMEDCQPHVGLVVEDFHCRHALGELEVLVELVEGLEELEVALELDIFILELRRGALLVAHDFAGCAWLRLDLNLGGHVAPQVLELHVIVVLDVVPRHLVHLGVGALALPLRVGVGVAILVLAER